MALTMADKIIINGAPAAWLCPVLEAVPGTVTLGAMMKMDNINQVVIGFQSQAAAAGTATEEFIQVTRADGAIIEFPKTKLTIDGIDETVKVSTAAGGTGDNIASGTIQFTANEADMDSANYPEFLKKIKDNINGYWLVCVPIGYNHKRRHSSAPGTDNAIGFAYLCGKINGALSLTVAPQTGAPLPLSFQSAKLNTTDTTVAGTLANAAFAAIPVKGMTPVVNITPVVPPAADFDNIVKGDIVFI
jgi:hypothetical protein